MTLGIMQPYFFPYLGYFDLINRTDRWIVFDTPQYMRAGWVNRNRILHCREGWQYIIVPIKKHKRETPINEVEAIDSPDWRRKIINQFTHYRGRAPFYHETISLLEECLGGVEKNLSRMNTLILGKVCRYLGIPWKHEVLSEMNLKIGPVEGPGDWALRISEAVGAREYLNPPGGVKLYDSERFASCGIKLTIQESFEFQYNCPNYVFEPKMSVLDALMWNSPEDIKSYLDHLKAKPN